MNAHPLSGQLVTVRQTILSVGGYVFEPGCVLEVVGEVGDRLVLRRPERCACGIGRIELLSDPSDVQLINLPEPP